jgi:hypothetical protein
MPVARPRAAEVETTIQNGVHPGLPCFSCLVGVMLRVTLNGVSLDFLFSLLQQCVVGCAIMHEIWRQAEILKRSI